MAVNYYATWIEGQTAVPLPERLNGSAWESEAQLVKHACRGSTKAFETLVERYEPRIRRMLYGLTQDSQLAQDLCQETFFAAFRALPRMDGAELRFTPWLYRIALNQARSEWRRRKHVSVVSFFSLVHPAEEEFMDEAMAEALMSSERFEESIVEQDAVRQVLAQLPRASVMCLLLDIEGFSYSEIAEIMHDSLSAVRSRLSRARRTFQRLYIDLVESSK